ncbi:nitroreductase [Alicyclobacillus contaminans]|uniref:nitroreductase family protein n=1 Tax=Alicyclobacillus contaminans TaxID=392016 RepID=UPI0003FEE446|nr:nitroreductase family protein [Alicyclobacillus contaminans]GMA50805.1 nitroreductase [Alicyclobacillus contaminans]
MTVSANTHPQQLVLTNRKAEYEIDPVFLQRWSPRAYSSRPVSDETLLQVLEAARWAPSAVNWQPWRFVVAKTEEDRAKFLSFLFEGNAVWCKQAPVLILLASESLRPDGEGENTAHAFDAGTAWGFLSIQAARLGLYTHAMGGFDKEQAKRVLNLPESVVPHVVISLGYYGDPAELPEPLKAREQPSTRRRLETFVFEGQYGQALRVR